MAELGRIERPEAEQFKSRRKLYVVPLLFSRRDSPKEYQEKYTLYWQQAREHVANLESRIGSVSIVYHESVVAAGEEGLATLEKLNPSSYQLVREKCLMGARLEAGEDRELVEEAMDWERHVLFGFISPKVAETVSGFYAGASKKRYEHFSRRIDETLKENEVGMLIVREGHSLQFAPDIEVFLVAPPALNDIHRWLREYSEALEKPGEEPPPEPDATSEKGTAGA